MSMRCRTQAEWLQPEKPFRTQLRASCSIVNPNPITHRFSIAGALATPQIPLV
jgi:hypothetical protein